MPFFGIRSYKKTDFIDVTAEVEKVITRSSITSGLCCVFVLHTTAAITINEKADPDVVTDLDSELNRLVSERSDYRHIEGNSPAHIKASLIGSSVMIPIEESRLVFGIWQGVFFCEFDGPRSRKVFVKIIPT
jgi:secondary thiamine-phosphate synthase enzyme